MAIAIGRRLPLGKKASMTCAARKETGIFSAGTQRRVKLSKAKTSTSHLSANCFNSKNTFFSSFLISEKHFHFASTTFQRHNN